MNEARLILAALMASQAGCYAAEPDPSLEATYTCDVDSDCAAGRSCILELCTDGTTQLGPQPQVLGPELLQVFPAGVETMLPIVVGGAGLTLVEPGGANAEGEGHVEVYVDGELFETLTQGDLEGRAQTRQFPVPSTVGFHRIEVVARQNDGTVYPNADARAIGAFWVDDGREYLAFLRPAPGHEVAMDATGELQIEVVTLNFALINPGFVETGELDARGQGHVHVFFDRGVPGCLPACNYNYESTGFPAMGESGSRLLVEGGVRRSMAPGTYPLEVVAQSSGHNPYSRDPVGDEPLFDVIDLVVVAQ